MLPIPWRNWPSVEDRAKAWAAAQTIPDKRIKLDDTNILLDNSRTYPMRRIAMRFSMRGRKERTVVTIWRDQIINGKEDSLKTVQAWALQQSKWEFYALGRGWYGVEHP